MPVLKVLSDGIIADLISFAMKKLSAELTSKREAAPSTISRLSLHNEEKSRVMLGPSAGPVLSEQTTLGTSILAQMKTSYHR